MVADTSSGASKSVQGFKGGFLFDQTDPMLSVKKLFD